MKKILKTIFLSIIISNITFITYADNECKIQNFEFNDIFEKITELNHKTFFLKNNFFQGKEYIFLREYGIIKSKILEYDNLNNKIDDNLIKKIYKEQINKDYLFSDKYINELFEKIEKVNFKTITLDEIKNNFKNPGELDFLVNYYLLKDLVLLINCDTKNVMENSNFINILTKSDLIEKDFTNDSAWFIDKLENYDRNNYQIIQGRIFEIYAMFLNGELDKIISDENINIFSDNIQSETDNNDSQKNVSILSYVEYLKYLKSSDEYSGEQYYLNKLNIIEAWKNKNYGCINYSSNGECKTKFNGKDNIVVAIIDDGINLNHLDITNKIWVNNKEIPGNKIDDDKNGYIDDFNGWNFYNNDNNIIPMGNHGTAVAGVIGGEANNGIGMAGIIPNTKIMSLGVFSESGTTKTEDVLKAVNYAIDNNADLINLSLEGSQFVFSQSFNSIFKKAYEKNIPIIVSAGNGDTLSSGENGVNTSINKLSPVCNDYGNKKIVMGVGSLQDNGNKSKWSNYGDCVDFWTYGENIFSLSILDEKSEYGKEYNQFNGTSFSAPILTGIIGLGINKVGYVSPSIIYDALSKSESGNIINANSFIDNLISLSDESIKNKKIMEKLKKFQEINMQRKEEINKKIENEIYYNKIKYSVIVLILIFIISIGWVIIYKKKFKT